MLVDTDISIGHDNIKLTWAMRRCYTEVDMTLRCILKIFNGLANTISRQSLNAYHTIAAFFAAHLNANRMQRHAHVDIIKPRHQITSYLGTGSTLPARHAGQT